jgi:hypothetical protein
MSEKETQERGFTGDVIIDNLPAVTPFFPPP